MSQPDPVRPTAPPDEFVRDPLANPGAFLAARQRSMAERLELAISRNKVASELRAGMIRVTEQASSRR